MNKPGYPIINVLPGTFGRKRCSVQGKAVLRCRKRPKFMIFTGDGKPYSSRLDSTCCEVHLPKAIKAAHDEFNAKRKV